MIPFSILSGKIQFDKKLEIEDLELRVLELANDSFQCRLPLSILKDLDCLQIQSFEFHFFNQEESFYEEIFLKDFEYEIEEKTRYWLLIRVFTVQDDFRRAAQHLTKEYMSYIQDKLYEDDAILSSHFSAYPADGDAFFFENESQQKEYWVSAIKRNVEKMEREENNPPLKLSLFLETPERVKRFLSLAFESYVKGYWEEHQLSFHPFSRMSVQGIHIGNSYCIHLLPDLEDWEGILEKACGLEITYIIPPVAQSFYKKIVKNLIVIHDLVKRWKRMITIEVNDMGLYRLLSGDIDEDSFEKKWECFRVIKGIMLHKKIKDSRMHYRNIHQKESLFYLDHSKNALYLPYYQMNTGTFCTLYAAFHYGDRGHQDRILACDRPCLSHCFLYPKHLSMMGRYNSLLGFNLNSMTNPKKLEDEISDGIEWMVINL